MSIIPYGFQLIATKTPLRICEFSTSEPRANEVVVARAAASVTRMSLCIEVGPMRNARGIGENQILGLGVQ